jgi:hypothetical protein
LTTHVELKVSDARSSGKNRLWRLADAGALANSILAGAGGANLVSATVIPAQSLLSTTAILALFGALVGASIGGLQGILRRVGVRVRIAIWIALGCLGGILIASKLGAFHKLHGPYAKLSLATIAVGLLGGAALGASLAALQPDSAGRSGIARLSPRWRWVLVPFVLVLGSSLIVYETTAFWLYTYPVARRTLNLIAVLCGYSALLVLLQSVSWNAVRARIRGVAVLLVLVTAIVRGKWSSDVTAMTSLGPLEHAINALRWGTDWDRDGASSFFGGGDCAPHNPAIYPSAREIPTNGIDDNCQFGDAKPPRSPVQPAARASGQRAPAVNVVLLTVDSLRPDRTSAYGYARDTTPSVARFARTALRFETAYTSGGWTCLALPSTFSGIRARRLEWEQLGLTRDFELVRMQPDGQLPPDQYVLMRLTFPKSVKRWTLPAALQERGIRTIAVLNKKIGHFAPYLGPGWDAIDVSSTETDESVTPLALARLASFGEKPGFLWVHYFNPHFPQQVHANVPVFGNSIGDRYDHEVLATDREIGKLIQAVEASGRPTAIVIAADHGEGMDDSRQFHGTNLHEDAIRIPLLLRAPGVNPGSVSTPVSLVDIAPTVLALTDTPQPRGLDGEDLRHARADRIVFTDLFRPNIAGEMTLDQIGVTGLGHRLTYDRVRNRTALTRIGDLTRPPVELDAALTPAPLQAALAEYVEQGPDVTP